MLGSDCTLSSRAHEKIAKPLSSILIALGYLANCSTGVVGLVIFLREIPECLPLDLLQKSKTHPPQSPRGFGGKQEKLGSLPELAGRVGEGSQHFCKRSIIHGLRQFESISGMETSSESTCVYTVAFLGE